MLFAVVPVSEGNSRGGMLGFLGGAGINGYDCFPVVQQLRLRKVSICLARTSSQQCETPNRDSRCSVVCRGQNNAGANNKSLKMRF